MGVTTHVPTVWDQLAENMYLKDSPTAQVSLSELAGFSFGRFQSSEGLPEVAQPLAGERGYIVVTQLKEIPFIEQFLGKKKVSSGAHPIGGVTAIDLQDEPSCWLPNPFDALVLYVTQATLDEVSYEHGVPRVERFAWPNGEFDRIVHHLGQTLVASLEQPQDSSKIFLDHVLHALHGHFVHAYGGVKISAPQSRGGLSPWQMRRATELLLAHLDGNIALQRVAEACQLSVSHFARAFKKTFHRAPYRWLIERRVDRASDLMRNSRLPLADIAARCGFADQSAFNRSFKRVHGISPGAWRHRTDRDSDAPESIYSAESANL